MYMQPTQPVPKRTRTMRAAVEELVVEQWVRKRGLTARTPEAIVRFVVRCAGALHPTRPDWRSVKWRWPAHLMCVLVTVRIGELEFARADGACVALCANRQRLGRSLLRGTQSPLLSPAWVQIPLPTRPRVSTTTKQRLVSRQSTLGHCAATRKITKRAQPP